MTSERATAMEADQSETPAWLNKEFVETLLQDNENDTSLVVHDVSVQPAVGKGENYGSQLHRVAVNFTAGGKTEHLSLIVKSLPTAGLMAKLIMECGIFERETKMYRETLPILYNLQANIPDADLTTFSSKSYKTTRPHTIVLRDLRQDGFKMAERHKGLDLQHTKLALKAMARLHALSIGQLAKDPTSFDYYTEPFFLEVNNHRNRQFIQTSIELVANSVEKWEGLERFSKKLLSIDFVVEANKLVKRNEGDLAVLNHGDGWTNNMLFQYADNGEVQSMKFVDFQIARYASPALDIQYFMHTSPNQKVRDGHWDEVIEDYYKTLVETLKSIDCESLAFSFEKLKQELHDKILYGVLAACWVLPIVLVDPEDAPDIASLGEEDFEDRIRDADSNFGKTYNGARFRGVFEKMLLHFEEIGAI